MTLPETLDPPPPTRLESLAYSIAMRAGTLRMGTPQLASMLMLLHKLGLQI